MENRAILASLILARPSPVPRVVVLGDSGVGKTTYATKFPNPIVLDVEFGLGAIDVPSIPIRTTDDFNRAVSALISEKHDYQTVIIDSADWLEELIVRSICRENKAKSIADLEWGRGYALLSQKWKAVVSMLDDLRARGVIVVVISHAVPELIKRPDIPEYQRMGLALQRVGDRNRLVEWADIIVYVQKSKTTAARTFVVEPAAGYIAKTRYTIPANAVANPAEMLAAIGWHAPEPKPEQNTIIEVD